MFVVDDFNALIQPGIIVQKQVLVILYFGKALVSKQVNDGNVKQKTADFMASVKKDVANKQ